MAEIVITDSKDRAWLGEYYASAPHFSWSGSICFENSEAGCGHFEGGPANRMEGFSFDGSFSLHYVVAGHNDELWFKDPLWNVHYCLDRKNRQFRVLVHPDETLGRLALMRTVREFAHGDSLRKGHIPVHGSCFLWREKSILVCGKRKSGKSTLLLHALLSGGSYLSNDRVFLDRSGTLEAVPTIVALRKRTLDFFADFKHRFLETSYDRSRTVAECSPGVTRPTPTPHAGAELPGISPAQLCRLCSCPRTTSSTLDLILFPKISSGAEPLKIEPLPSETTGLLLYENLLRPSTPLRTSQLFDFNHTRWVADESNLRRSCLEIATGARGFRCYLGSSVYQRPLEEWLDKLLVV